MQTSRKIRLIRGILLALVITGIVLLPSSVTADGDDWPQFHKDTFHTGYSSGKSPHIMSQILWSSPDIGAVDGSSVAVAGGNVYVNCGDYIRCLNAKTGAEVWSKDVVGCDSWDSWAGPVYDDGKVFISGSKVYAFDASTGTPLWAYDLPDPYDTVNGNPMAADGKVYVGDWDGNHYYCLDADTSNPDGTWIWDFEVDGLAQGSPTYYDDDADGLVFLTSYAENYGGNLYCVNAASGALI
ncbi:MAG: PQQ-like beta-propeller repeat protein [Dehalococcoidales bacterium]|nr:PQQ-like beta-propeller repeat protein [Dehalococcoidales bacterium]